MKLDARNGRRLMWIAVLAVGVGVRLAAASGRGLWIDEVFTYQVVTASPLSAVRLVLTQEYSPPLFSVICWLLVAPFRFAGMGVEGISTLIRLIAVAMFPAAVGVLFACWKRGVVSSSAALMTAWLIAIAPVCVRTGSDARTYALVVPLLLLSIGVARWTVQTGERSGWRVGVAFLLLSMSHYYGMFVAAGLLAWIATSPGADGETGETLVGRIAARRSALLFGGAAIGVVSPLLLWQLHRKDALIGTAHVPPGRFPPSVWMVWVTLGLIAIWVAVFAGLFNLRLGRFRTIGASTAGLIVLVLAISPTFLEKDGLHAINPGFAAVLGVCLAVSAADHLSNMSPRTVGAVAVVALAASALPLRGIVRDVGSMGRTGTLDLAQMANDVIDDSRARPVTVGEKPVVWNQEWTWADRYVPDVIMAATGDKFRFAYMFNDDDALGALTGEPFVESEDLKLALLAGGKQAAVINSSTEMYFISRRLRVPDLEAGLAGCGFKVTRVKIYVSLAVRQRAFPCR